MSGAILYKSSCSASLYNHLQGRCCSYSPTISPGAMQPRLPASRRPTFFPSCKLERVDRHALLAKPHAQALAAHLAVMALIGLAPKSCSASPRMRQHCSDGELA